MNPLTQKFLLTVCLLSLTLNFCTAVENKEKKEIKAKDLYQSKEYNDKKYTVTLENVDPKEAPYMEKKNITFSVTDKTAGKKTKLNFSLRACTNPDFMIIGGKYLFFEADLRTYFPRYVLADLKTGKIIHEISSFDFSFSPTRRYMYYRTYFTKFDSNKSTFFMILDMERVEDPKIPIQYNDNYTPPYAVGWPLYPKEYVESLDWAVSPDCGIISPILWSENETRLVFLSFNELDEQNYVVDIDISEGLDKPKIKTKPISLSGIKDEKRIPQGYRNEPFPLSVQSLEWISENEILAVFEMNRRGYINDHCVIKLGD